MWPRHKPSAVLLKKTIHSFLIVVFLVNVVIPSPTCLAQGVDGLSPPGQRVGLSEHDIPVLLKGLQIDPENPLKFKFVVDSGNSSLSPEALKSESEQLIKYFLAALTVPENDLWVNLSPHEKDRIIPPAFGQTEMGKVFLAQDYLLKQLSSSLMYPEEKVGKEVWAAVNKKAREMYGTIEIPINTFNKIWVVPDKAVVYESSRGAFVVESRLKAMLDEDYVALNKGLSAKTGSAGQETVDARKVNTVSSDVIRRVVLPILNQEINEGKSFASLRQVFYSLILASWFKKRIRSSLLNKVYVNQNKIYGVDVEDKQIREKVYQQYLEAVKTGVYNYIREESDPVTQEKIPRKYFAGGITALTLTDNVLTILSASGRSLPPEAVAGSLTEFEIALRGVQADGMISTDADQHHTLYHQIKEQLTDAANRLGKGDGDAGWERIFANLTAKQSGEDRQAIAAALEQLKALGFSDGQIQSFLSRIFLVNVREDRLRSPQEELGGLIVRQGGAYKILLPRQSFVQGEVGRSALADVVHELVETELLENGVANDQQQAHHLAMLVRDVFLQETDPVQAQVKAGVVLEFFRSKYRTGLGMEEMALTAGADGVVGAMNIKSALLSRILGRDVPLADGYGDLLVEIESYPVMAQSNAVERIVGAGEGIIPALVARLSKDSLKGSQRKIYHQALARFGDAARPILMAALRSDFNALTVQALADMNVTLDSVEQQMVIRRAQDGNPDAIRMLGQFNITSALPFLRSLLELNPRLIQNERRMLAAVEALSLMGDSESLQRIQNLVDAAEPSLRARLIEATLLRANPAYLQMYRRYADPAAFDGAGQKRDPSFPGFLAFANAVKGLLLLGDPGAFQGLKLALLDQNDTNQNYHFYPEISGRSFYDQLNVAAAAMLMGSTRRMQDSKDFLSMVQHAGNEAPWSDAFRVPIYATYLVREIQASGDNFSNEWILAYIQAAVGEGDPGAVLIASILTSPLFAEVLAQEGAVWAMMNDWDLYSSILMPYDFHQPVEGQDNALYQRMMEADGSFGDERVKILLAWAVNGGEVARRDIEERFKAAVNDRRYAHEFLPAMLLISAASPEKMAELAPDLVRREGWQGFFNLFQMVIPLVPAQDRINVIRALITAVLQVPPGQETRGYFASREGGRKAFYENETFIVEIDRSLRQVEYRPSTDFLLLLDHLPPQDAMRFLLDIADHNSDVVMRQAVLTSMGGLDLMKLPDQQRDRLKSEVLRVVKQTIDEYRRPVNHPEFSDPKFVAARVAAVKLLPGIDGTYAYNTALLEDPQEHKEVREAARSNLVIFEEIFAVKHKSILDKEQAGKFRQVLLSVEDRLVRYLYTPRRVRSNRLRERYKEIEDNARYDYLHEDQTEDPVSPASVEDQKAGETLPRAQTIDLGQQVFDSDPRHAPTPRLEARTSPFIMVMADNTNKSVEEMERELEYAVARGHFEMSQNYGFIDREDSPQAEFLYQIFDRMKAAYNEQAGDPQALRGKFFLVDSPDVNAWVYPGHVDLYMTTGCIRELASFALENGFSFEQLIAAIMGHEMTHILQGTSYEGIPFARWLGHDQPLTHEVMDLKRRAEYNADQGAIPLLTRADYNPAAIMHVLEFMRRNTRQTTAEVAVQTHPHPKERIANVQAFIERDSSVFRHVEQAVVTGGVDLQSFADWNPRHLGSDVAKIHSFQDVIRLMGEATTIQKVFELVQIANYMDRNAYLLKVVESPQAQQAYARQIFVDNVVLLLNALLKEGDKIEAVQSMSFDTKNNSGQQLMRLMETETYRPLRDVQDESVPGMTVYESRLREVVLKMKEDVMSREMDSGRKMEVLDQMDRIAAVAVDLLGAPTETPEIMQNYIGSDQQNQQNFAEIVRDVARGDLSAVSRLLEHPYALYEVFGQKSLDQELEMRNYLASAEGGKLAAMGIDVNSLDLGKIRLERASEYVYGQALPLLPVATPEDRQRLVKALMIPYFFGSSRANASPFRDFSDPLKTAIADAVKRLAPDASSEVVGSLPYEVENIADEMKSLLAQYLTGDLEDVHVGRQEVLRALANYSRHYLPSEAPQIYSDFFRLEYTAEDFKPLFKKLIKYLGERAGQPDYRSIERGGSRNEIEGYVEYLLKMLPIVSLRTQESEWFREDWNDVMKAFVQKELGHFSVYFRKQVLSELLAQFAQRSDGRLRIDQVKELLDGLVYPGDAYSLMVDYVVKIRKHFDSFQEDQYWESGQEPGDRQGLRNEIKTMETLMSQKPAGMAEVPQQFMAVYVSLRLLDLKLSMREDYEREMSDGRKLFKDLNTQELQDLSRTYLTVEVAADILKRMSSVGPLLIQLGFLRIVKEEDDLALGKMSEKHHRALIQAASEGDGSAVQIPAQQAFVGLFHAPIEALEQRLFMMLFDLPLEDLQTLAINQRKVRDDGQQKRGRISMGTISSQMEELLDLLILYRLLGREGIYNEDISSENLEGILLTRILRSKSGASWRVDVTTSFARLDSVSSPERKSIQEIIIERFSGRSVEDFNAAREFFMRLKKGGFIGKYSTLDSFFSRFSNTFIGLALFEVYAELLTDLEMPTKKTDPRGEASLEARSYLEALVESVELRGMKARIFRLYDAQHLHLLASDGPVEERIRKLAGIFPEASMFRDGFLSEWERRLVPEMDLSRSGQIARYVMQQKQKGKMKEAYDFFETTGMMAVLQWEKVEAPDFHISDDRVNAALDFYQRVIPLIFNPELQLRMGITAMKIFRRAHPQASLADELARIKAFFPLASPVRDQTLNELLDRHVVLSDEGGIEQLTEIRKMYLEFQFMSYDEELTTASSLEQMAKALMSMADRDSRAELLFWMLDPGHFAQPAIIREIKDKMNIDFDELPHHMSFLPNSIRERILESLFLGENGLFTVGDGRGEEVMRDFLDQLFSHFFPQPGSGRAGRKKGALSPELYEVVRSLFPVVMQAYSPGRRTFIVMSLLRLHDKLGRVSDGQKLAVLLAAMGPVGIKLGQVLSENKNVIPSDSLRMDLGTLKKKSPPISKMAVLNALEQAGYDLATIRVGRMLATASMGQVHEGQLLVEGKWVDVVIKVLKPKILRTIEEDMTALRAALKFLKEGGYDVEDIAPTVEEWIRTESDFGIEAGNTRMMAQEVEVYLKDAGETGLGVPRVYPLQDSSVMVSGRIRGIELGFLLKPGGVRSWLRGEGWLTRSSRVKALIKKGLSEEQASRILSTSLSREMRQLRVWHLHQLFERGRFHADLHRDNVMVDTQGEARVIDFGLIGQFAEEQRRAGQQFFKGVLTHNLDDIFEGVRDIHVHSSGLDDAQRAQVRQRFIDEEREIRAGLSRILSRHLEIGNEVNEISAYVVQRNMPGNSDFSTFMKAFTTSIWLFPEDLIHGLPVLNDFARVLGLGWGDRARVAAAHGWPVVRNSLLMTVSDLGGDLAVFGGRIGKGVQDAQAGVTRQIRRVKWIRESRRNLDKVFGYFGEAAERMNPAVKKRKWSAGGQKVAGLHIPKGSGSRIQSKDIDVRIDDEALLKLDGYQSLPESQRPIFKETLKVYLLTRTLLETRDPFLKIAGLHMALSIPTRELFLAAIALGYKLKDGRSGGKISEELVAAVITDRVMRQRYPQGPRFYLMLDENPVLRDLAEKWTELYLRQLDMRDALSPLQKQKGTTVRRRDIILDQNVVKGNHPVLSLERSSLSREDLVIKKAARFGLFQSSFKRSEGDALTPDNVPESGRQLIGALAVKAVVGLDQEGKTNDLKIKLVRTGYSKSGRFEIDVFNPARNEFIHLSLTKEELDMFISKGRATAVYVDRWERQPYDPSRDQDPPGPSAVLPQGIGSNVEREQAGEGGIGVSLRKLIPKTSGSPGQQELRQSIAESLAPQEKGGLDFTPEKMNVEIIRDMRALEVPLQFENLDTIPVDGFEPMIIQMTPMTGFQFLSVLQEEQAPPEPLAAAR